MLLRGPVGVLVATKRVASSMKGVLMQRMDWMMIVALVVLGVVAETAIAVLTLMGASEYIEFGIAMVLFVAVLVGSYLFVIVPTPQRRREERDTEE
jgi:Zn-dependent protease